MFAKIYADELEKCFFEGISMCVLIQDDISRRATSTKNQRNFTISKKIIKLKLKN